MPAPYSLPDMLDRKRQIITPMCIVLAGLIALHSLISDDSLGEDRSDHPPPAPPGNGSQ
ncbi:hypothetical protein HX890_28210 [Pseudomonas gingeri]|uniref:hypothetical protein n=1 Tax=Pseudomonas gingeri TaxID=117681 RepID=UPI00159F8FAB|nr:hypothetical protein [Pseudomonas gingeri]NWD78009.1 hypothetical protein [Pseudomonas gingeri]